MPRLGYQIEGTVQALREAQGWTQDQLAVKAELNKRTIQKVEGGRSVDASTVRAVARALGVSFEKIVGDEPVPEPTLPKIVQQNEASTSNDRFRLHVAAPSSGLKLLGRDDNLRAIHQKLDDAVQSKVGVVTLHGVPGVGKSSLMNHLGHDSTLGRLFPDGGLWTAVGNTPDVGELIRIWGRGIRIPSAQMLRVDEAIGAIRQKLQRKRMLVLVDDVWTDAHAEMFRGGGAGSVVLYATRIPALAQRLAPAPQFIYSLPGLETPQALDLLATHAPDVVRDYPQACADLVHQVDGLPLAIIVAGKMLQREHSQGEDMKRLLNSIRDDARVLLTESAPASMSDLLSQTTPDVAAVLRRSTDVLDEQHKWYFARLGAFAASPATFEAKFAGRCWKVTADEAKRIAKYFVDLGLLSVPKRGHFQIHPLMQALALHEWDKLYE